MYSFDPNQNWPPVMDISDENLVVQLAAAAGKLGEIKGRVKDLPNQDILLSTIRLQEAKDSSEIENIVTTHEALFKARADAPAARPATKEVENYVAALWVGLRLLQEDKDNIIRIDTLCQIQECIIPNKAGIRKSGVHLANATGERIYEPPQDHTEVLRLLNELLVFINDDERRGLKPSHALIKMAQIHHRFEAIHPFYDGNGRVGRILNILYLIQQGLLDSPILYLSRYITHNKAMYYQLLREVQQQNNQASWRAWIFYMLRAVQTTAEQSIKTIERMEDLRATQKRVLKEKTKIYSHELLDALFDRPYVTRRSLAGTLEKTPNTALRYLRQLEAIGILNRMRSGKTNYYVHTQLVTILMDLPRLEDKHDGKGNLGSEQDAAQITSG